MHRQHKEGAVLIFALVIMGMVTLLTQQLINSVAVGIQFSHAMIAREQAEMLAMGGVQLGIAQLGQSVEVPKAKSGQEKQAPEFSFKAFITHIVPHLNRWQTFDLQENIDGIEGQIKLCIVAEEGKLPYKRLFDEPARDLSTQGKELFKNFGQKKVVSKGGLVAALATFFKRRTHRLQDVTGLALIADKLKVPLFYAPQERQRGYRNAAIGSRHAGLEPVYGSRLGGRDDVRAHHSSGEEQIKPIALQDLFTLWPQTQQANPLVLSDAACAVLGLRRPQEGDAKKRADRYKQLAEGYDKVKGLQGDEMWKTFAALYDTKPKLSKELMGMFSPAIEPRFYSVLCYATVAGVMQRLLAIIERVPTQEAQPPADKKNVKNVQKSAKKEEPLPFKVRRLYWI